MRSRDLHSWMWGEALSLVEQAEHLRRQFFHMSPAACAHAWEPPVDLIETSDGLHLHMALPGVAAGAVTVRIEPDCIVVSAVRAFPECPGDARIHRVEIPYGRFERRISFATQAFELAGRTLENGLLTLVFARRVREERKEAT
jgi:HSP20 family protein